MPLDCRLIGHELFILASMFLGHMALGLAARRARPDVPLAAWFVSVQLVDLIWPIMLLVGLEHVRIAPGITAFTPLDFYDYPLTHSLVGGAGWAALFAGLSYLKRRRRGIDARRARNVSLLFAAGVLSHWVLDVISHRPDVPVLPNGPYLGLGLWYSVPATLAVELTMFAAGLTLYVTSGAPGARRISFWLLIALLVVAYFAAAFGPPPPDARTIAWTALAMWLLIPWARWADR
jgi:hypothetical protein